MENKFKVNEDLFGRYCEIEQGFSNEKHIYKIINTFRSNSYKDKPLRYNSEQYIHDEIVQVLTVVHCGIDETKCERVALKDVELLPSKHISKNKIRKMIETLEEQEKAELEPKDVMVLPKDRAYLEVKAEYYHKKNVLQDLLKEE